MIKFSILIPNYRCNPFLKDCLESALIQTKSDTYTTEILICDQSNDIEHKLVNEVISSVDTFNNIKVIKLERPSIVEARKELIRRSTGDYIIFLDSDDYLSSQYLNNVNEFLEKRNFPDVVIQNFIMVDVDKSILKCQLPVPNDIEENLLDYFYYSNYLNSVVRKIFRRELYCENETPTINVKNGDDWIISYSIMKRARQICFLRESFGYYYRQNITSSTHEFDYKTAVSALYFKDDVVNPNMNSFQKTLYLKQKMYDFLNCFRFLVKNKKIKIQSFILDAKKFRENLLNFDLFQSSRCLSRKQLFVFNLLKHKFYRTLFIIFKF